MNIMTYFEKLVEDLSSKPYHIVSNLTFTVNNLNLNYRQHKNTFNTTTIKSTLWPIKAIEWFLLRNKLLNNIL